MYNSGRDARFRPKSLAAQASSFCLNTCAVVFSGLSKGLRKVKSALFRRELAFVAVSLFVLSSVLLTVLNLQPAQAATSSNLNFQARLLQTSGALVADGTYNIQFNLYDVSAGGSALWTETRLNNASQGVTVKNGYLSVNLGSITAFPGTINWDQELWLGMTVRGTGSCVFGSCTPTDAEMTPRFKLTSVPYAFSAGQLQKTNGANNLYVTTATPTADITYVFQDAAAGTYNVCTTASVCTGYAASSGSSAYIQNGTSIQANANFAIQSAAAGNIGAVIRGHASQSADLLVVENSGGTDFLAVQADGDFVVDGTTLFVDAVGNEVGIGTATPGAKLEVSGTAAGGNLETLRLVNLGVGVNTQASIDFALGGATNIYGEIGVIATGGGIGDLVFSTANGSGPVERMRLQGDGDLAVDTNTLFVDATNNRVGIGTASPGSGMTLHVTSGVTDTNIALQASASGNTNLYLDDAVSGVGGITYNNTNDSLSLYANGGSATIDFTGLTVNNDLLVDTNTLYVDATNNRVGINTSSVNAITIAQIAGTAADTATGTGLYVNTTLNSTSNSQYGAFFQPSIAPASASTAAYRGISVAPTSSSGNLTGAAISGVGSTPTYTGTGTVGTINGLFAEIQNTSTGTITNSNGLQIRNPVNSGGGTITSNYGLYVGNQTAGTNDYGIYVLGADTYALWIDAGTTRLDGDLEVDSTTLRVFSSTDQVLVGTDLTADGKFEVHRSIASATTTEQFGSFSSIQVQVADTNNKIGNGARAYATHTSGTIDSLMAYSGGTWAQGSGGTVQNAYGIWIRNDTSTGATVVNSFGLRVDNSNGAGTTQNQYGVYIPTLSAGSVSDVGVYIQGADTYALWVDAGATRLDGTLELGTLGSVVGGETSLCRDNTSLLLRACAGGGGSLFTDAGTHAYLTATTDNLTIGSTLAGGKLFIDGDTDEIQLQVQGNATQTADLFVVENSGGTDLFNIQTDGDLVLGGSSIQGPSAGLTVTSGTASGANLTLQSTSNATRGFIDLRDKTRIMTENKTFNTFFAFDEVLAVGQGTTLSIDGAGAYKGIVFNPTIVYISPSTLTGGRSFEESTTHKNVNGVAQDMPHQTGFYANATLQADGAAFETDRSAFLDHSIYGVINSGTLTAQSHKSFESDLEVNSGATVVDRRALDVDNATGAGSVTNQYGTYIAALTKGTNNAGVVIGEATGTNQANLVIGQTTIPAGSYSIYNSSADQNYFAGNLGIGDDTPNSVLHVKAADPFLTIQDTDTGTTTAQAWIRFAESDGSGNVENYWEAGGTASGSNFNFVIQSNSSANAFSLNRTSGNAAFGSAPTGARVSISGGQVLSAWGTSGAQLRVGAGTFTDSSTAASGTATNAVMNSFGQQTLAASNTGVTTTNAATVYIQNAPAAGTNQTITNAYALWVDDGATRLDGNLVVDTSTLFASSSNNFVGIGTATPDARLELDGNQTAAAWGFNGIQLQASPSTYTDSSTAASGTAANAVFNSFGRPTLTATNSSVTTTNAATVYIQNSPLAGTNQTITNAYSLWVDNGTVKFDEDVYALGKLGVGTTSPTAKLEVDGGLSAAAWGTGGIQMRLMSSTFTDTSTAASGTASIAVINSFAQPTLAATNSSVTTTNAATVYIANAPAAGTNQTITNAYALWVANGATRLDGATESLFNGAASTPAVNLRGSIFTGGTGTTTTPQLLVQPSGATSSTWNTAGTALGANVVSGFTGNFADFKLNGTTKLLIDSAGGIYFDDTKDCANFGCFKDGSVFSSGALTIQSRSSATSIVATQVNIGDVSPDGNGRLLVLDEKNNDATDPTGVNGGMYYNSFVGKFRCYQDGAWQDCVNNRVILGSDVSDSSGACTFTNVTGLSFAAASGVTYGFRANVSYTSAATSTGLGLAASGPTASKFSYSFNTPLTLNTTGGGGGTGNNGSGCVASAVSAATTGNTAVIEGIITTTASGTLQLTFASEINTSAVVIKAGSYIEYWKQ